RKAIHSYLKAHARKTATTADFLEALNRQTHRDVATAFSSFLDQSGVPLVSAELTDSATGSPTLRLSQKRYLPVGSSGDVHRHWGIPVRLEYQTGGDKKQMSVLFNTPQQTVNLSAGPAVLQWLCLNRAAAGYYVSAYHGQLLTNLLRAGSEVSPAERMDIAHSISAAVRSADLPIGEALSVMPSLLQDAAR